MPRQEKRVDFIEAVQQVMFMGEGRRLSSRRDEQQDRAVWARIKEIYWVLNNEATPVMIYEGHNGLLSDVVELELAEGLMDDAPRVVERKREIDRSRNNVETVLLVVSSKGVRPKAELWGRRVINILRSDIPRGREMTDEALEATVVRLWRKETAQVECRVGVREVKVMVDRYLGENELYFSHGNRAGKIQEGILKLLGFDPGR